MARRAERSLRKESGYERTFFTALPGMSSRLGPPRELDLRGLSGATGSAIRHGLRPRATFTRENIAKRPANLWRYAELLPLPEGYRPDFPVGMTPLVAAPRLGARLGVAAAVPEE